ncbi:MAG: hypothetical protein CHACPFDD_03282 [Phycisphaerae bacterium]|nr:hypothetical protein [Phycisphaerae bacterium]
MDASTITLCITAATIGFVHTLAGPDHYVPFVAMARAGRWSLRWTVLITLLCGLGHVFSSVILGMIGIAAGRAVEELVHIESWRGDLAGWLLLAFGIAYAAWGLRRAWRNIPHRHLHVHADGTAHSHEHNHHGAHVHVHTAESGRASLTPWIIFTIFVFGPCEPLIPLLMYPAATSGLVNTAVVATVFGVVTIGTMLAVVSALYCGLGAIRVSGLERYAHAAAGATIALCGLLIQWGL